jgi:hypothetical protein
MSGEKAGAASSWLIVIEADQEYRHVFGDVPHLQIHGKGVPLPSPLSAKTIDVLRSQGVPEQAIETGMLDIEALVQAGWNVSSALPDESEDASNDHIEP